MTEEINAQTHAEDTKEENYYRIMVRNKKQFAMFRNQDVGEPGHIQRLAGKRPNGSWDTQAWLVSKDDAYVEHGILIPSSQKAKELFEKQLGSKPRHMEDDMFEADPRVPIPEVAKPTLAQIRARRENIKKALAARRKKKK